MKIKRSGFTLVELLGVIIILGLLMTLVLPNIVNSVKSYNKDTNKVNEKLVLNAMDLYISDNNEYYKSIDGAQFCVSISDLTDEDYLKSPVKYGDLDDITLTHSVKVTYNHGYNYEIVKNDSCPTYVCKRATELHTEICSIDGNTICSSYGSDEDSLGKTLTFGSLGTNGKLTSGDAFDCDVNGDGIYDSATERFYYVTDLKEYKNYAVMLYYNNTVSGESNNTTSVSYNSYGIIDQGPINAVSNLPTISQWNNLTLTNSKRQIINSENIIIFDYSGYAARFLTYDEVNTALNGSDLKHNLYLIENTSYTNSNRIFGYWLETIYSYNDSTVWSVNTRSMNIYCEESNNNETLATRPAIEVPKYSIEY